MFSIVPVEIAMDTIEGLNSVYHNTPAKLSACAISVLVDVVPVGSYRLATGTSVAANDTPVLTDTRALEPTLPMLVILYEYFVGDDDAAIV